MSQGKATTMSSRFDLQNGLFIQMEVSAADHHARIKVVRVQAANAKEYRGTIIKQFFTIVVIGCTLQSQLAFWLPLRSDSVRLQWTSH